MAAGTDAGASMKAIQKLLGAFGLLLLGAGIAFWARPVSSFNETMYAGEFLSGVESRSVQVEGYRVHYLADGPAAGPVVVLVHGLGGSAEDWLRLAHYLARAGCRVYMPDLLGYGRSEKPADFSYSVQDEAHVVAGFLDTLGLGKVDLGGWSMGGWIVQLVAFEHPQRIERLMLFDSGGLRAAPAWNTQLFTPSTPAELNQLYALLMPHPPWVPGFVAHDILRVSRRNDWIVHRALATMLTGRDTTDQLLPKLRMPVLIVWGAEDRIFPLSQGETMQRLVPGSELEIFPGCGHLAPRQCAARIGPAVVEFVHQ
ncbi:MAG: alpha/beta fold hydrolase [Terracidiphilus sp.]